MKLNVTICVVALMLMGCTVTSRAERKVVPPTEQFHICSPQKTNIWWCDTLACGGYSIEIERVRIKTEESGVQEKLWFDDSGRVIKRQYSGFGKCDTSNSSNSLCEHDPCKMDLFSYDSTGNVVEVVKDIMCDGIWDRKAKLFYDEKNMLESKELYISQDNPEKFSTRKYKYDLERNLIEILTPFEKSVKRDFTAEGVIEEVFDLVLNERISTETYSSTTEIIAEQTLAQDTSPVGSAAE